MRSARQPSWCPALRGSCPAAGENSGLAGGCGEGLGGLAWGVAVGRVALDPISRGGRTVGQKSPQTRLSRCPNSPTAPPALGDPVGGRCPWHALTACSPADHTLFSSAQHKPSLSPAVPCAEAPEFAREHEARRGGRCREPQLQDAARRPSCGSRSRGGGQAPAPGSSPGGPPADSCLGLPAHFPQLVPK